MARIQLFSAVIGIAIAGFAPTVASAGAPSGWAGYIDLGASGIFGGEWGNYFDTFGWDGSVLHATGKVATDLAPSFTVQGDASANYWSERASYGDTWSALFDDFAAHASWHPSANSLIGGFASYGGGDGASYGTFGVEAQHWMGATRVYGQLGFLSQLGSDETASVPYVEGVLTHYFDPNVAVSVFAGYDHATGDNGTAWAQDDFNLGARLELKPSAAPMTVYVSYLGFGSHGAYAGNDVYNQSQQQVSFGIRVPLGGGGGTLKALDQAVGLSDMNPWYGEMPH